MHEIVTAAYQELERPRETVEDWGVIARAAQEVANALGKDEDLRQSAQLQALPNGLLWLLHHSDVPLEAHVQLLRVVGNLCIGNQNDIRELLIACGAPAMIAQSLASVHADELKVAVGAALNLSMDWNPAYEAYVSSGLYEGLLDLVACAVDSIDFLAGKSVRETICTWSIQIIEGVLTAKVALSLSLLRKTIATLCAVILTAASNEARAMQLDPSDVVSSAQMLETLALDEEAAPAAFLAVPPQQPLGLLADLCTFVEKAEVPAEWPGSGESALGNTKAGLCKALSTVAAADAIADACFAEPQNEFFAVLLSWILRSTRGLTTDAGTKVALEQVSAGSYPRSDLLVTASIVLGNLARRDQHCETLVHDHDLVSALAQILRVWSHAMSIRGNNECSHVLHGVLGLLKHLAIPASTKSVLGESGIIESLISVLAPSFDSYYPVQHSSIGVLKHLCTDHVSNAQRIVGSIGLDAVLGIIDRAEDFRLQSEATRILCHAVRSLWSSREKVTPSTILDELRESLSANLRLACALAEMVRIGEKYAVLLNEGATALAILAATKQGTLCVLSALLRNNSTANAVVPSINGHASALPVTESVITVVDNPPHDVTRARADTQTGRPSRQSSKRASSAKKASSAAATVAVQLGNASLPHQIRSNLCALIGVAMTCRPGCDRDQASLARIILPELQTIRDAPDENEELKLSAERIWQAVSSRIATGEYGTEPVPTA